METKQINLERDELLNLPLFFRKIQYNKLCDLEEENKLVKYNNALQSMQMSYSHPIRQISKTVDYKIFSIDSNEKQP